MKEKLYILVLAIVMAVGIIRLKNYFLEPNYQKISIGQIGAENLKGIKYIEITDAWFDGNYVESTKANINHVSSGKTTYLYPLLENSESAENCRSKVIVLETIADSMRIGKFRLRGQILPGKLESMQQASLQRKCEIEEDHVVVMRGRIKPSLSISFLIVFVTGLLFIRVLRRLKAQRSNELP